MKPTMKYVVFFGVEIVPQFQVYFQVAHIYGGLTSTVPPCFDVMSDAADAAFMSSGIMSVFTAVTEVSKIAPQRYRNVNRR